MVLLLADAAALADFDGHGARDHVARCEVLGRRRVALHEALALGIGEIAAFPARAFGDQAARAVDAGGVELDEFHVLEGQAGAQHHGIAVAGAGVGRSAREIGAPVTAGRENGHMGAETVDGAVVELERDHAAAAAFIHDEVEDEILDEEIRRMLERGAVKRVQHGVAGAVGRGAGALRDALAVKGGHAAERALVDLALFGARKRNSPMLEFVHRGRRVAAHVFDGVLIAEPVRSFDGVVHVPAPVVLAHVAERRGNAALGRDGVRAGRKHLADAGGAQPRLAAADHRAQPRAAGPDHDDVVAVIFDRIGPPIDRGGSALC